MQVRRGPATVIGEPPSFATAERPEGEDEQRPESQETPAIACSNPGRSTPRESQRSPMPQPQYTALAAINPELPPADSSDPHQTRLGRQSARAR